MDRRRDWNIWKRQDERTEPRDDRYRSNSYYAAQDRRRRPELAPQSLDKSEGNARRHSRSPPRRASTSFEPRVNDAIARSPFQDTAMALPSPANSASDGDNVISDPRLRKRPDIARIATVSSPSTTETTSKDRLSSNTAKDVEMADNIPKPNAAKGTQTTLAKSLLSFGRQTFNDTKQSLERDELESNLKEISDKKAAAESSATPHTSLLKYLSLQVRDTEKSFTKANNKSTASRAALEMQVETVVKHIDSHIDNKLHNHSVQKSAVDSQSVKTELEILRADFNTLRTRLDEYSTIQNNAIEVSKVVSDKINSATAQSQSQALRINTLSHDHNILKTETMTSLEVIRKMADGKASQSDQSHLEASLKRVQAENDALRKEIDNLRSSSITREEFDIFKQELSQKPSALEVPSTPMPLPEVFSSYIDRYNNDVNTLRKDLASMKELLSTVDSRSTALNERYERLAPTVYETSGAMKSVDTRVDKAIKQLGSLEDKVRSQVTPAYPSPPAPANSHLPGKFEEEVQKFMMSTNSQLLNLSNDTKANLHAWRALTMRYNNLTTEQLVQQISGIVYPMLPKLQTENAQLKDAFASLKQIVQQQFSAFEQTKGHIAVLADGQKISLDRLDKLDKLERLESGVYTRLSHLEDQLKPADEAAAGGLDKARAEFEAEIRQLVKEVKEGSKATFEKVQAETRQQLQTFGNQANTIKSVLTEHSKLSNNVKKVEEDLEAQRQRQGSMALQVDEAVNDRIHDAEQLIAKQNERLALLEGTSKDVGEFIKTTTEALETNAQQHWVQSLFDGHQKDCADRSAKIREEVKKEKELINEHLVAVDTNFAEFKAKGQAQTDNVQTNRLKNIEDSVRTLETTVKSHAESIEALDGDVIKHFQAPQKPLQLSRVSSTSSSAAQAPDTSQDPMPWDKPSPGSGDVKFKPPSGPRAMLEKATTRAGKKHRTSSPAADPRSKKRPRNSSFEVDKASLVDLTSDDDDLTFNPTTTNRAMLGSHKVTKGPAK